MKIRSEELRLGNVLRIKATGELMVVSSIYNNDWIGSDGKGTYKVEELEGVELDEAWLGKLGSSVLAGFPDEYIYGQCTIDQEDNKIIFVFDSSENSYGCWDRHYMELDFVHQLQNIWLLVNNKELTINQPSHG